MSSQSSKKGGRKSHGLNPEQAKKAKTAREGNRRASARREKATSVDTAGRLYVVPHLEKDAFCRVPIHPQEEVLHDKYESSQSTQEQLVDWLMASPFHRFCTIELLEGMPNRVEVADPHVDFSDHALLQEASKVAIDKQLSPFIGFQDSPDNHGPPPLADQGELDGPSFPCFPCESPLCLLWSQD